MKQCLRAIVAIALLAVASLTAQARYLQPDPLGVEGGGPNLYVYAGNDPVQNIDPDGLQFFPYSRNLNRTSLHPDKVPDAFALRLNVPYVMGAGFGIVAGYVVPTVGPPLATQATKALLACLAPEAADALKHCVIAGTCFLGGEMHWSGDQQRKQEISTDSRTPHRPHRGFPGLP